MPEISSYAKLSLPARLAVALHCFERYCRAKGLRHGLIDTFIERLWELPCALRFADWEKPLPQLVHVAFEVGRGEAFPNEILDLLASAGVLEKEFGQLLVSTVDIIYGSAYGASNDVGSLKSLELVLCVATSVGVAPPPAQPFLISLFGVRHGWGLVLDPNQRDIWRHRAYDGVEA